MIHGPDAPLGDLAASVSAFIADRVRQSPLGSTATAATMDGLLAGTITDAGLGTDAAWQRFTDAIVPNTVGLDSERFLAFIPVSPSAAGVWMDAAVSAANFSAESWLEAAGAVAAENQALQVLIDAARMPAGSGGCFMSGGSIGNLSALAVARDQARGRAVVVADSAHASVHNALHLLGLDAVVAETDGEGRMTGPAVRAAVAGRADVGIVVAAAGSTNGGVVDDLATVADATDELDAWLHVDGAYGGAALLLPELQALFAGIDRVDSLIIDPHKWLFSPAGSCALLYRSPELAAAVHTQHGPYLDILHGDDEPGWNPSDYGFQLTRRASGLPLWFALAAHGVDAHREAIRVGISLARTCADRFGAEPGVELVLRPQLGVVVFRREGWGRAEWRAWAARLLDDGIAFVAPSTWRGEPVGRLVFMHPRTPPSIIDDLAASLR